MFTDQFNILLEDICHTTTGEFAKIGKYDRSYIAHLRNGDRIPSPGHHASIRLSHALHRCAAQKGELPRLCEFLGLSSSAGEGRICAAINTWLYAEDDPDGLVSLTDGAGPPVKKPMLFAGKLVAAMELGDISNQKLARELNVDSSVTSKYRSGLRVLRPDSPRIGEIAAVLARHIYALERVEELAMLVGVPLEALSAEESGARQLEAWLRDFNGGDSALIESFLNDVDNFLLSAAPELLTPEEAADGAASDSAADYWGTDGIRRAVLRFLFAAVRDKKPQLLLYSDQNMDWMVADHAFALRWMSLMYAYVSGGGRIQIIHNVDRGLEEILAAIRSWLPLYISGGIESYYCLKSGGNRFFRTQFLEPEGACISADHIVGREENARYRYITAKEELAYCRTYYEDLLSECMPLFRTEPMGTTAGLPVLRKGKNAHRIGNTLSLASMPQSLLGQILARAELPEEVRRGVSSDWFDASAMLAEKLKNGGAVHECVCLPDGEALASGRIPVDTERAELFYTPEEFRAHLRATLALSEQHPAYRFHPLTEAPFHQIRLAASEETATFGCFVGHTIHFTASHPQMCQAFVSFVMQLEEQNDYDVHTLKKRLKQYL